MERIHSGHARIARTTLRRLEQSGEIAREADARGVMWRLHRTGGAQRDARAKGGEPEDDATGTTTDNTTDTTKETMMGSLYKLKLSNESRGWFWRAKYYDGAGRCIRVSTNTESRKEAERFLRRHEGAVAAGAPIPPRLDRITYDEVSADLRTFYQTTGQGRLSEVEARLAYLDRFFRGRRAAAIGPALITEYVAARQGQRTRFATPPANRTINIELALLKRMLRLAARNGKLVRVPPIDMLKDAPAREGFFEAHQYDAVRRHLPEDLRAAVTIAFTFGWRKSEILSLERRHLDLRAGTLRSIQATRRTARGASCTSRAISKGSWRGRSSAWRRSSASSGASCRASSPISPASRDGASPNGGRARVRTRAFPRACSTIFGAAVRNLERAGIARSVAMKITGHKTESVYRRYAIVSDSDLQEATRKLTGTPTGTPSQAGLTPAP